MVEIIPYVEDKTSRGLTQLPWHSWFKLWGQSSKLSYPLDHQWFELTVRLTDNQEIKQLNSQYRDQDQPTDVLAFATLDDSSHFLPLIPDEPIYLGDIIISVETAHRQSEQRGHNLKTELAWLTTHGLLHLLGWDHPDEKTLISMLSRQESLLKIVNLEAEDIFGGI